MNVAIEPKQDGNTLMEAVRGYLRELRVGRHISQDELAGVMGITKQALLDWEKGRTQDIKTGPMLKAVEYLRGKLEDIAELVDASVERGVALAYQRLADPPVQLTEEQQRQLHNAANAVPEERLQEVLHLLEDLQERNKTEEWVTFGRFLKNGR
jgi:transcriptional regulator with XRE-family HTH domain